MGGKGATGAQSTNDQVVAMQQQQAAQATQANQERNARLSYGTQNIKNIFEGTPTGSTPLDFSSITQANAPTATGRDLGANWRIWRREPQLAGVASPSGWGRQDIASWRLLVGRAARRRQRHASIWAL